MDGSLRHRYSNRATSSPLEVRDRDLSFSSGLFVPSRLSVESVDTTLRPAIPEGNFTQPAIPTHQRSSLGYPCGLFTTVPEDLTASSSVALDHLRDRTPVRRKRPRSPSPERSGSTAKNWVLSALSKLPLVGSLLSPHTSKEPTPTPQLTGSTQSANHVNADTQDSVRRLKLQHGRSLLSSSRLDSGDRHQARTSFATRFSATQESQPTPFASQQPLRVLHDRASPPPAQGTTASSLFYQVDPKETTTGGVLAEPFSGDPGRIETCLRSHHVTDELPRYADAEEENRDLLHVLQLRQRYGLSSDVAPTPAPSKKARMAERSWDPFTCVVPMIYNPLDTRCQAAQADVNPFITSQVSASTRLRQKRGLRSSDYRKLLRQTKFHPCKWIDYFEYAKASEADKEDRRFFAKPKETVSNRVPVTEASASPRAVTTTLPSNSRPPLGTVLVDFANHEVADATPAPTAKERPATSTTAALPSPSPKTTLDLGVFRVPPTRPTPPSPRQPEQRQQPPDTPSEPPLKTKKPQAEKKAQNTSTVGQSKRNGSVDATPTPLLQEPSKDESSKPAAAAAVPWWLANANKPSQVPVEDDGVFAEGADDETKPDKRSPDASGAEESATTAALRSETSTIKATTPPTPSLFGVESSASATSKEKDAKSDEASSNALGNSSLFGSQPLGTTSLFGFGGGSKESSRKSIFELPSDQPTPLGTTGDSSATKEKTSTVAQEPPADASANNTTQSSKGLFSLSAAQNTKSATTPTTFTFGSMARSSEPHDTKKETSEKAAADEAATKKPVETPSLFSLKPDAKPSGTTTPLFGQPASGSLFGAVTAEPQKDSQQKPASLPFSTTSSTSLFGAATSTSKDTPKPPSLFESTLPTPSDTSGTGGGGDGGANPVTSLGSTSLFGGTSNAPPASGSLFASTGPTGQTSLFGGGSVFGSKPAETTSGTTPSLFGTPRPADTTTSLGTSGGIFGTSQSSTSLFGAPVSSGTGSTTGLFGASASTTAPLQSSTALGGGGGGDQRPPPSLFGLPNQPLASSSSSGLLGGDVGTPKPSQQPPSTTAPGTSLFGASPFGGLSGQQAPASLFLGQTGTSSLFGGGFTPSTTNPTTPPPQSSLFGQPLSQPSGPSSALSPAPASLFGQGPSLLDAGGSSSATPMQQQQSQGAPQPAAALLGSQSQDGRSNPFAANAAGLSGSHSRRPILRLKRTM